MEVLSEVLVVKRSEVVGLEVGELDAFPLLLKRTRALVVVLEDGRRVTTLLSQDGMCLQLPGLFWSSVRDASKRLGLETPERLSNRARYLRAREAGEGQGTAPTSE
jgi:hypothetical protein